VAFAVRSAIFVCNGWSGVDIVLGETLAVLPAFKVDMSGTLTQTGGHFWTWHLVAIGVNAHISVDLFNHSCRSGVPPSVVEVVAQGAGFGLRRRC